MSEKDIDEQIAKMTQEMDQMTGALRDVAKTLGAFRSGLIEAGFTIEEVIPMCTTQLTLWWSLIMQSASQEG